MTLCERATARTPDQFLTCLRTWIRASFAASQLKNFRDITTRYIASPEKNENHHAVVSHCLPSATMSPHEGVGGGIPTPRKLSEASTRIRLPTRSVAITMTVLNTPGRRCRIMMRVPLDPATRAHTSTRASQNNRTGVGQVQVGESCARTALSPKELARRGVGDIIHFLLRSRELVPFQVNRDG